MLGEIGAIEEEAELLDVGEVVVLLRRPLPQAGADLLVVLLLAPQLGHLLGTFDLIAVEVDRRLPAEDRHAGRQSRTVRGDELGVESGERAIDDLHEVTLHSGPPSARTISGAA